MTGIARDMRLCTGCAACAQTCIRDAVKMAENEEGFLYPEIDSQKCSDCGLCKKVCPVNSVQVEKILYSAVKTSQNTKVYACFSKDADIRESSSSGGVFSLLAQSILSQNGVVFGAGFDESFKVRHDYIEKIDGLDGLRRSKYVQSNIENNYKKAGDFLDAGRKVLFCGTPCQIAGLKAFLVKDYVNLLTCDLACHGVPSPKVWNMYLDFLKERYDSGIAAISFRDKSTGWTGSSMRVDFDNGRRYMQRVKSELFFIGFGKSIFNRRSCFDCQFRLQNTKADITLADFWGIDRLKDRDFCDNKGVSLVITHTEAGEKALSLIGDSMCMKERRLDEALTGNPRLISSCREPAGRESFFKDLKSGFTFDKLRRKYMDNFSAKYRLKCLIKHVLNPESIKKLRDVIRR